MIFLPQKYPYPPADPACKVVKDEEIPDMLELPVWKRTKGKAESRDKIFDPVFFFNTFRFDGQEAELNLFSEMVRFFASSR